MVNCFHDLAGMMGLTTALKNSCSAENHQQSFSWGTLILSF